MASAPDLYGKVVAVVKEFGKVDCEIPPDKDLYSEIGIESVNSIAILLGLEEHFSCAIDDRGFTQARTLTALVELVSISVVDAE